MIKSKKTRGVTLVEVVIATALILVLLLTLTGVYNMYLTSALENTDTVRAAYLAEEGVESVKLMRDFSWASNIATLAVDTNYYLTFTNSKWQATTTFSLVDSTFDRKFVLSSVNRDSSSNITSSGGTLDPNTRKLTVTLSWPTRSGTSTQAITTYIDNIFIN
ncbi:prepilin-type N-terminal cleavage/methylation domain-containing protein [Candidatus Parcubacteria bacterium]|nr:prepilin-type N-terminal cleavage/methylation domain-containing protein [Candidatus Parcubacteria bacterium]